jgi:colanic acid/amylovoran biosynthesis glycosyltransferase
MRVAFVLDSFPVPAQTFVLNQMTGLLDLGHEVDIYPVRLYEPGFELPDVIDYRLLDHVHHTRRSGSKAARVMDAMGLILKDLMHGSTTLIRTLNGRAYGRRAMLLHLLFEATPAVSAPVSDAILCHFGPAGIRGMQLREVGALKGRLAVVFHGFDLSAYLESKSGNPYADLFEKADLLLPVSDRWKQRLLELGAPEDKIVVHQMGVDPQAFRFSVRTLETGESVRLISLTRLVEKKGIEYAIRAVARLDRLVPVVYDVIGDGPLRSELETLIRSLGVQDRVRLHGWKVKQEVIAYLDQAHVLVAPSVTAADGDEEGIPVALMEAMAVGLPVVTTRHSGIPELVQDGVSGYLVPERDVEALADRLNHVVSNPTDWEHLGRAGRAFVEQHHNIKMLNSILIKLLGL